MSLYRLHYPEVPGSKFFILIPVLRLSSCLVQGDWSCLVHDSELGSVTTNISRTPYRFKFRDETQIERISFLFQLQIFQLQKGLFGVNKGAQCIGGNILPSLHFDSKTWNIWVSVPIRIRRLLKPEFWCRVRFLDETWTESLGVSVLRWENWEPLLLTKSTRFRVGFLDF